MLNRLRWNYKAKSYWPYAMALACSLALFLLVQNTSIFDSAATGETGFLEKYFTSPYCPLFRLNLSGI